MNHYFSKLCLALVAALSLVSAALADTATTISEERQGTCP